MIREKCENKILTLTMTNHQLSEKQEKTLIKFAKTLIDQKSAKPIVYPQKAEPGFWFGGGNLLEIDSILYLCGRYRNYGDSREGITAGLRGFELVIFKSIDDGQSFDKIIRFTKQDLAHAGLSVKSIEGAYLHWTGEEVELYASTEKEGIPYPRGFESLQKPNTGVWTIDRITAPRVEDLNPKAIEEILRGEDPQFLHIKDPFGYHLSNGDFHLLFCSHPYCWSSSNTGFITRKLEETAFSTPDFTFFPRGAAWDVAITRGTSLVKLPKTGQLVDAPDISLMFYDGGECFRNLDEHKHTVSRPRGYSCEEIGGLAYILDDDLHTIARLSRNLPMFISPYGLGTSRYVDVLKTDKGYYATWQQSQADGSQALVMNFLPMDQVYEMLN